MLLFSAPRIYRQVRLRRWCSALDLASHQAVFQKLFADVDGFALSRQARLESDAVDYVYGEINFISYIALLSLTKPSPDTIFYDLGSGIGKAVLACAMVFNVKKSAGIELFSVLHQAALKQQQRLEKIASYASKAQTIQLINDDFFHADFSDATLIFINATAFFGETWQALNQRLNNMTACTTVITTSKKLSCAAFTVTRETRVQMSWGIVKAYIQQRTSTTLF